jgi:hypothetical protein
MPAGYAKIKAGSDAWLKANPAAKRPRCTAPEARQGAETAPTTGPMRGARSGAEAKELPSGWIIVEWISLDEKARSSSPG